ncbi:interferon-gamma-inducible GTPase 10-like [Ochotona princeps]|uniref:interferon-gamma-inducible GTPase 10-like n=1 Tax=Ochotona princeps TaxID=9978 RepID=UPI002714AE67|nr:interferon-gamma-inducible GTPase 10-like [Ochotona princeps]
MMQSQIIQFPNQMSSPSWNKEKIHGPYRKTYHIGSIQMEIGHIRDKIGYLLALMGSLVSTAASDEHSDLLCCVKEYFKNFSQKSAIISQETSNSVQLCLAKGDIQGACSIIRNALKDIDKLPLSIAVTGETGSGKSSLVNSLRGVGHEEEDAAPTGAEETTMERRPYKHPRFPSVTIWDLPGIGTVTFQPKDYLKNVKFAEYDFFIIVCATRFKKSDIDLAKAIKAMKKNFYFVRTKVDIDLQNEQTAKPNSFDREEVWKKIRDTAQQEFRRHNIDAKIFLISSLKLSEFDFPILMDTLLEGLNAQKHYIFTLFLPNITEAAIDKKRDSLKQIVWLEAMKAGLLATLPVVSIIQDQDVKKLKKSLHQYQLQLGVDDLSLQSLAKDLKVPVKELQKILISPHLFDTEENQTIEEKLRRYLEVFISAIGGPPAMWLHFEKVYLLQEYFLDIVAADAKALLKMSYLKN